MKQHLTTVLFCLFLGLPSLFLAQNPKILRGQILDDENRPVPFAAVSLGGKSVGTTADTEGVFELKIQESIPQKLTISAVGFAVFSQKIESQNFDKPLIINLKPQDAQLNEVVVTGTMKEVQRSQSPAPIEVYNAKFFFKNPTPSLFDALGNVNGVRPQLQCNVCNTGDIHINGMEGAYTMVMIDGAPIVSGLSTVYGLLGIPNSMIERIEVMKGPASTLYGSEAVGGLINVITKSVDRAPRLSFDLSGTSYSEWNSDFSTKFKVGKTHNLLSINNFYFNKRWDINNDNFTDVTLAKRFSVFNKINFDPSKNSSLAFRYIHENRFGGEMQWQPVHRGGEEIYGEQISTNRLEIIGNQQFIHNTRLQYSYNWHNQNSVYGATKYIAQQQIGFAQLTAPKSIGKHDLLFGAALRYTFYDDNTPITASESTPSVNQPSRIWLPGIFTQNEWKINPKHSLLMGLRLDYNSKHGFILSPRANYKWSPSPHNQIRLSYGNGFRVVNLFSEEHAALTGARQVVVAPNLSPERSQNINVNYVRKFFPNKGALGFIGLDMSLFYTRFSNKIIADYDTDPDKILFDNLEGFGVSQGMTFNLDFNFKNGLKILAGATAMDVWTSEKGIRNWQIQTPRLTANYSVSYSLSNSWLIDFTGTTTSPMRLPVLPNDFRPSVSPTFSLLNLQVTKTFKTGLEIYGGVKNLLHFTPKNPIMRPFDPFDTTANDPLSNPNSWTFDPSYNYAPLQGRRAFLGIRWQMK